jgi:hypothetical protein
VAGGRQDPGTNLPQTLPLLSVLPYENILVIAMISVGSTALA